LWARLEVSASAQKASVPRPQNTLALGQAEVEQLLLLIAGDRTGKITKEEWMKFMEQCPLALVKI
jgi:hypothetical protein